MGLPVHELDKMIGSPLFATDDGDLVYLNCRTHGLVGVFSARGVLVPEIVHLARAHLVELHKTHAED